MKNSSKGQRIILSDDDVETVTSYVDGYFRVRRKLNITDTELTEALLDAGVEKCKNPSCGWYDECGSMLNDEGDPDGLCDNCRRYKKETR